MNFMSGLRQQNRVVVGELGPTELRKQLGLTHSTFYRYRKNYFEKIREMFNLVDGTPINYIEKQFYRRDVRSNLWLILSEKSHIIKM